MIYQWEKIGMLTANGLFECHTYADPKTEGHHIYVIENIKEYNKDTSLRYMERNGRIRISGNAALDPYGDGHDQIACLAALLITIGIPDNYLVFVVNTGLNTRHEGKLIGLISDWV